MTEQTPDTTTPGGRRGGYLPVLPDGWEYNVRVHNGSEGLNSIDVMPEVGTDGETTGRTAVHIYSPAGHKSLIRDTLPDALREAVSAAKVLDRLARTEAEYAAARKAALDSIGGDEDDDYTPQVEQPAAAGSLAKDDGE